MTETISGRLVLPDGTLLGHLHVDDGVISDIESDGSVTDQTVITPGFIDVHVHGWGGHDAMGGADALSGMARSLAAHGITSFLPTSVTVLRGMV